MEPIVPSTEITAPQTDAPRANETLARPMAIAPRHSEFTLPDEPAPSRVDRPETETRSLPAATNPRGRQHPKPAISVKEDREGAPNGVELVTTDHVIRPAATEATVSLEFPSNISPSPQPAPQLPIQVRIGRVEVRGTPPAPEPTRATPMETPPLGFASYHRLRRYRN
jgi:hypothetical protein